MKNEATLTFLFGVCIIVMSIYFSILEDQIRKANARITTLENFICPLPK